MTYRELFGQACKQGVASHETLLLLEHLFSISRTSLLLHFDDSCDESLISQFNQIVAQRISGYPLQYLLGEWEFFGLPFYVGEGVLIPRADTEVLVETALELCDGLFAPNVCDLCSGSGCIPIALSKNLPESATFTAVELSDAALTYLHKNKERHQCDNLAILKADVTTWQPEQTFDVITSNPPYIGQNEIPTLQAEVLHEPLMALQAQEDGLYFYRILSQRCYQFLKENGWIIFEIGYQQRESVCQFLKENGFSNVRVITDYSGNDRVVIGQKIT